ncbi:MacS family sensor histidine kinase [Rhodococcus sp. P1Y]|uniref:MacS family sensor histidine kinase n=1 Tax=Rhodococcus sp. P1Y TaxID=1302308 RepID=UPI00268D9CA2
MDLEVTDAVTPLWRASQAFRLITLVYAVSYQVASMGYYSNARLSWFFVALMAVWTGLSASLLSRTAMPRWKIVLADQLVVIGLMASTRLVADYDWYSTHQTLPTTLWATNAVISAAILFGPRGGVGSGVLLSVVSAVVRDQVDLDLWTDATAPVLLSVGLALGLASNTARRAHAELERAARLAAITEERERLARQVHDGVLQVLALVRRRGSEIGGVGAELADLAGEQEVALRMLISEQREPSRLDSDQVDLRSLLRLRGSTTVSVSAPPDPVLVDRIVAEEISAVVATALSNVEMHAGEGARAYVLLEDVDDEIIVSIRDDGRGIAPGRLAAAEAEGRMGVSKSILGRVAAIGGTALLETDVDAGTEWEIRVPKGKP